MSSNPATTSVSYSGGVEATAITALKAQFATFFVEDPTTKVKAINQAGLANWLRTDFSTITTGAADAYDATADVADFAASLTPLKLGFIANTVGGAVVTAVGVATKKAEVEALGAAVDEHYAALSGSSASRALEDEVKKYLAETDLTGQFPEIVQRIVDPSFYVTTWVTEWGEESAPSPPSQMIEADQNDLRKITRDAVVPAGRGIVGWRAYRSNSGNTQGGFQLVPDASLIAPKAPAGSPESVVMSVYGEINRAGILGVTGYEVTWWLNHAVSFGKVVKAGTTLAPVYQWPTDGQTVGATWLRDAMLAAAVGAGAGESERLAISIAAAQTLAGGHSLTHADGSYNCFALSTASYGDIAKAAQLQESLATTTWLPPPAGLRGITDMANGITAGFVDNAVYFSEPYAPYAWPEEYRVALDYPVVAIAAFGTTLFAGTRGSVYLISGSDPASMSAEVVPGAQVCVSARSVVSADQGAVFASAEGICLADAGGVRVVTKGLFTRETWSALNPETIVATMHDGVYYFQFTRSTVLATGTRAEVVAAVYKEIGRVGRVAPTAGEVAWWVTESTAQGWSNFETRRVMLISAATFVNDPTYSTQGAAAVALIGQTPTVVVNQVYTDIGRTDQTPAEVAYWVNQQATEGWTNEVLRLTMLQSASTFVDNPIYQHNADLAITLLQRMVVEGCYALDIMTGKLTQVDMAGSAFFTDRVTDTLYTVKGATVSAVFEGDSCRRSVYRTGVIKLNKAEPFAWLQVDSDFSSPVVVKWLGDGGVVRHTSILMNNKPVRLPPGRYLEHEVEILSLARVTGVTLASTTDELKNV